MFASVVSQCKLLAAVSQCITEILGQKGLRVGCPACEGDQQHAWACEGRICESVL